MYNICFANVRGGTRPARPLLNPPLDTIVQFQDDTARIIYAYRDEDPEDENDFRWHGTEGRGVKFVYLLNAVTKPDLSGSIMTRDMLQTNVSTNIDKKNNKNNNKKYQQAYFIYSEIIHAFVRN